MSNEDRQAPTPASPEARFGYVPCLDGIRAIAILLVLLRHFKVSALVPGGYGVTVFFFVSGLLITRLLLAEDAKTGRISLGQFYLRRFVRLMPALFALVLVIWGLNAWRGIDTPGSEISATLFYYRNYFNFANVAAGYDVVVRGWNQTWSLAIEEHFYLLFPPLLIWLGPRSFRSLTGCALLCLPPLVLRCIYFFTADHASEYIYGATETRLDSILAGCVLALLTHHVEFDRIKGWIGSNAIFWVAALLSVIAIGWREPFFQDVLKYTVQEACLFVMVFQLVHLDNHAWLRRLLEARPMTFIGRISYSLYLWHWQAGHLAHEYITGPKWLEWLAALAGSVLLAVVSYYVLEMPIVGLRRRLGSHTTR